MDDYELPGVLPIFGNDIEPAYEDASRYYMAYKGLNLPHVLSSFGNVGYSGLNTLAISINNSEGIEINVIKSIIDTLISMLKLHEVRINFSGIKSSIFTSIEIKDIQKALDSYTTNNGVKNIYSSVLKNSLIYGVGILKIGVDRIKSVVPGSLYILPSEYRSGFDNLTYIKEAIYINYRQFKRIYKDITIVNYGGNEFQEFLIYEIYDLYNKVMHIEHDGKIIKTYKYEIDTLPYEFFLWNNVNDSCLFYGIPKELKKLQDEINKTCESINKAIRLSNRYQVYISDVDDDLEKRLQNSDSNSDGGIEIIKTTDGRAPNYGMVINNLNESIAFLNTLINFAYNMIGINEAEATGGEYKNLRSSLALNTLVEIKNNRFNYNKEKYISNIISFYKRFIKVMSQDRYKENYNKSIFEDVDFKLLVNSINSGDVLINVTSDLPTDPAVRIDMILALAQFGDLDSPTLIKLVNNQDLNEAYALLTKADEFNRVFINATIRDNISIVKSKVKYYTDKIDIPVLTNALTIEIIDVMDIENLLERVTYLILDYRQNQYSNKKDNDSYYKYIVCNCILYKLQTYTEDKANSMQANQVPIDDNIKGQPQGVPNEEPNQLPKEIPKQVPSQGDNPGDNPGDDPLNSLVKNL